MTDGSEPPEVLPFLAERLIAAGETDLPSAVRAALSYAFGPEFAASPAAADLCAFAELHGVEALLELLQSAEGQLKAAGT